MQQIQITESFLDSTQVSTSQRIPTLREAWAEYQEVRHLKDKTKINYRLRLERNLGEWLDLPLDEITRTMILIRFKEISQEHESMGNYTMRTLRSLFNFAIGFYEDSQGNSILQSNPVSKLSQVRAWNPDRYRQRTIMTGVKQWYRAVLSLDSSTNRDLFLLLLFTGMRKGEALSLEWNQVDLSAGTIQLFRTKNGDDRLIPLSDFAWRLISMRRHFTKPADTYVFQRRNGKHMKETQKAVNDVIRRSGVPFACHDLRRTFATFGDEIDLKSEVVKALLGHRGDVTEDYTCRSIERLRRATQKITDVILKAVTQ